MTGLTLRIPASMTFRSAHAAAVAVALATPAVSDAQPVIGRVFPRRSSRCDALRSWIRSVTEDMPLIAKTGYINVSAVVATEMPAIERLMPWSTFNDPALRMTAPD